MKPLILDFITKRSKIPYAIRFRYDPQTSVNIVVVNGVSKPFIDLERDDVELMTKTKIQLESDDERLTLAALATKTKWGEKEDLHDALLKLQTKTLKVRERNE